MANDEVVWQIVLLVLVKDVVDLTPSAFDVVSFSGETAGVVVLFGHTNDFGKTITEVFIPLFIGLCWVLQKPSVKHLFVVARLQYAPPWLVVPLPASIVCNKWKVVIVMIGEV